MTLLLTTLREIRRSGAQEVSFWKTPSWSLVLLISCGSFLQLLGLPGSAEAGQRSTQRAHGAHKPAAAVAAVDEQMLKTQVMLDRAGYSPGEIDALHGTSTERALAAYTKDGGKTDDLPQDALTPYAITEQDAAGPFTPGIPSDMMELSKLPSLGYTGLAEALGERFHASPALLKRLNPDAKFAAGETIRVPNVANAITEASGAASATVTVRKSTSDLVVTDNTGKILMYAPVTTGSEHDPLPIGDWKATGVQKNPTFFYNPDLFWDADQAHAKAKIPPGPNNPVGVVWIDISRPHYGLHGHLSCRGRQDGMHGCVAPAGTR